MSTFEAGIEAGSGSVSGWIELIRLGNTVAIEPLLERYFQRLVSFSDRKLRSGIRTSDDGEDIALQVIESVFRKIGRGSYPKLSDRNDLWLVLMVAAQRRVIDKQRKVLRWERHFAPVRTLTDLMEVLNDDLGEYLSKDDGQRRACEMIDLWDHMLSKLKDPSHREIAMLKLDGYSNRDIAIELKMTPKRVDRAVESILERWRSILDDET
jgi:DNA-directed RNA polymerase specialized sigma24 family protein